MHLTVSTPVQSLADLQRIEATPLAQSTPWASTYALIRTSCEAHPDRPALTFLTTGQPGGPATCWTYRTLLQGIHQTANALHSLHIGPQDVVAILLPGGLAYHLALWGGEAAGIVQPLNPLLSEEKLLSLLQASQAKVLIAHGVDDDSQMRDKALRLQAQLPQLHTVLFVHPDGHALASGLPPGTHDFHALRQQQASDRLQSERVIQASDIAAYFHTGGTTGAPKLARHSHGAQVFTAWANATMQGFQASDVTINGYPLFHVAGVLPGALCSLAVGMHIVIPTAALFRHRDVVQNYWRLAEHHGCTLMSGVPTVLAALAGEEVCLVAHHATRPRRARSSAVARRWYSRRASAHGTHGFSPLRRCLASPARVPQRTTLYVPCFIPCRSRGVSPPNTPTRLPVSIAHWRHLSATVQRAQMALASATGRLSPRSPKNSVVGMPWHAASACQSGRSPLVPMTPTRAGILEAKATFASFFVPVVGYADSAARSRAAWWSITRALLFVIQQ